MSNSRTKRVVLLGMLTAVGLVLAYLESLVPPLTGIPGVKAGFANIAVMTAMFILGPKEAFCLAIVRILISGVTFSGMFASLYSLAGAMLSLVVMLFLKRTGKFSIAAISVAGGTMHNIGQILVAVAVTGRAVAYYLPVLILLGAASGFLTGILSSLVVSRLSESIKK